MRKIVSPCSHARAKEQIWLPTYMVTLVESETSNSKSIQNSCCWLCSARHLTWFQGDFAFFPPEMVWFTAMRWFSNQFSTKCVDLLKTPEGPRLLLVRLGVAPQLGASKSWNLPSLKCPSCTRRWLGLPTTKESGSRRPSPDGVGRYLASHCQHDPPQSAGNSSCFWIWCHRCRSTPSPTTTYSHQVGVYAKLHKPRSLG